MAETELVQKSAAPALSYAELRRRVRETLLWGQQAVEEARVRTYWETGWWIKEHLFMNRLRARYGEDVLGRLSGDVGVSESVLDRCKQFAEKFPELFPKPISADRQKSFASPYPVSKKAGGSVLTWTHYRSLLTLEDSKLRQRLAGQASRQSWSAPKLESHIKWLKKSSPALAGHLTASALLQPKRGELLTYRIVEDGGGLALDHGFTAYWNLSRREASRFRAGDIVRKLQDGKLVKLKGGTESLLYTYEADVARVVDGDTCWMKIYLEGRAGQPWVKEKLRLRDIDAPEIQAREGKAAKRFVERLLKSAKSILITTTKPDKWDRYLSDVFLIVASGKEIYLNNLLLEKGHARIKASWSLEDWEGGG